MWSFIFQQASPSPIHLLGPEFQEQQKSKPNAWALCQSLLAPYLLPSHLSKWVPWPSPESVWEGITLWHGYKLTLNSLGTITATVYHTAVSSFSSLPNFLERSYIAMNNWAVPSLHWGISLFPQNSVNSISLALYRALASFSDAVLPPQWDGVALMNWKIVLSQGFSDFLMVCM